MPGVVALLLLFTGSAQADSTTPEGLRLANLENSRIQAMARLSLSRAAHQPFAATFPPTGEETIVLPAREVWYSVLEVRALFPAAFEAGADFLLLHDHIVVAPGGTLDIRGPLDLRLASGSGRMTSIAGVGATIHVGGGGPVSISSWDPAARAPDQTLEDGRAFVLMLTGQMDISDATFRNLGFGTGATSGVAWKGVPEQPAGGSVSGTRFEGNFFGAYTFQSDAMRWIGNVFANNVVYGFDPHDYSNHFVVQGNEAFGNGRHGIIFSRGCSGNVITGNSSHDNAWHGIVLDDGRVREDGDPRHVAAVPSNDNVIENNQVWNNGLVGIALEGGTGNVVRDNVISHGRFGIRLKDDASRNQITGNSISGSTVFGVFAVNGSDANDISGNHVAGGKGGFVFRDSPGNHMTANQVSGVRGHAVAVIGNAGTTEITGNSLDGQGSSAIDLQRAADASSVRASNDQSSWDDYWLATLFRTHPILGPWMFVLLVPLLLSSLVWVRRMLSGAR